MAWFRKKKNDELGDKYVGAFLTVGELLRTQGLLVAAAGKLTFESATGSVNGPALGYIFGMADGALQAAGLQFDEIGRALLVQLLEQFSDGKGEYFMQYLWQNRARSEIVEAMCLGGTEYLAWLKSGGSEGPMGWPGFFGFGDLDRHKLKISLAVSSSGGAGRENK